MRAGRVRHRRPVHRDVGRGVRSDRVCQRMGRGADRPRAPRPAARSSRRGRGGDQRRRRPSAPHRAGSRLDLERRDRRSLRPHPDARHRARARWSRRDLGERGARRAHHRSAIRPRGDGSRVGDSGVGKPRPRRCLGHRGCRGRIRRPRVDRTRPASSTIRPVVGRVRRWLDGVEVGVDPVDQAARRIFSIDFPRASSSTSLSR